MSIIAVSHLSKAFQTAKKEPGLGGSLKSIFSREYKNIQAVEDISFEIEEGELVGFIGPNGAGKTTTLKCLSGLLYPSAGEVSVLGFKPFDRKAKYLKQISLVMGQKNQLWWDLPAMDSFLLNKEIYEIPVKEFQVTLDNLTVLMDVKDILHVPVRNLSLGQRMKCELIAALLHKPKVLFLDEPTIGLDVVMQENLREFVREYNTFYKATIILTSHYMEDVKELCERVIIIDHGKLLYDGKLIDLIRRYSSHKLLSVVFHKKIKKQFLENLGEIKEYNGVNVILSVPVEQSNQVASKILEEFPVNDLNIEEPKIEDIIREVFSRTEVTV